MTQVWWPIVLINNKLQIMNKLNIILTRKNNIEMK